MADHDITAENIREVTVQTNSHAAYLDNPCPPTMENAQYSIPFVIARTSLVDGICGPEQMQQHKLSDPVILDMAKRIHLELEPEFDMGYPAKLKTRVQVTLKTGETVSAMSGKTRGDDNFPLSDREIEDKFAWMSSNRLNKTQTRAIMDEVWSLETLVDMAGFYRKASCHVLKIENTLAIFWAFDNERVVSVLGACQISLSGAGFQIISMLRTGNGSSEFVFRVSNHQGNFHTAVVR